MKTNGYWNDWSVGDKDLGVICENPGNFLNVTFNESNFINKYISNSIKRNLSFDLFKGTRSTDTTTTTEPKGN